MVFFVKDLFSGKNNIAALRKDGQVSSNSNEKYLALSAAQFLVARTYHTLQSIDNPISTLMHDFQITATAFRKSI